MSTVQSRPSTLAQAQAAWGAELPDWVAAMARAIDAEGFPSIAQRLGYRSSGNLYDVVARRLRASTDHIEARVRAAVMRDLVECPVQGRIGGAECLANQALPFSTSNPAAVRLWRACRGACPYSSINEGALS